MKSVLLSIQPKWVEKIAGGNKTIEVRKRRPKIETPFKCYIYCTKSRNKNDDIWGDAPLKTVWHDGVPCVEYADGKELFGWRIDDLKIYDKPKELGEFYSAKVCKDYFGGYSGCEDVCGYAENGECFCGHKRVNRPPQDWCYVEEVGGEKK